LLNKRRRGKAHEKSIASVVAVFVLLLPALASSSSPTSLTKVNAAGAGGEPRSVAGSINRGSGAIVNPGYTFVRRGAAADVVRAGGRFKTGTYVCHCRSGDANQKCELLFSPRQIFCKQGSCSGVSCQLVPVEAASSQ
jgi:hypothetical protein